MKLVNENVKEYRVSIFWAHIIFVEKLFLNLLNSNVYFIDYEIILVRRIME